jgi:hypothetical protein
VHNSNHHKSGGTCSVGSGLTGSLGFGSVDAVSVSGSLSQSKSLSYTESLIKHYYYILLSDSSSQSCCFYFMLIVRP